VQASGHHDQRCTDKGSTCPSCYSLPPSLQRQVEMWVRAQRRVPDVLPGLHIEEGERVLVEISRKFRPEGGQQPGSLVRAYVVCRASTLREPFSAQAARQRRTLLMTKGQATPHNGSFTTMDPSPHLVFCPAAVAAMAGAAGLLPCGGTWGSAGLYSLTLLLTPEVALQRCWADTDSLFAGIADWEAQVGWTQPNRC